MLLLLCYHCRLKMDKTSSSGCGPFGVLTVVVFFMALLGSCSHHVQFLVKLDPIRRQTTTKRPHSLGTVEMNLVWHMVQSFYCESASLNSEVGAANNAFYGGPKVSLYSQQQQRQDFWLGLLIAVHGPNQTSFFQAGRTHLFGAITTTSSFSSSPIVRMC